MPRRGPCCRQSWPDARARRRSCIDAVRVLQPPHHAQVRSEQPRLKQVFAVQRKRVADQRSADRAERQAFHVLILRPILPHPICALGRGDSLIPDRERADLSRRRQIPLLQRRRDIQDIGHVVEAVRRVVGRQQRCRVDVQREQIANRVGVLSAIQPMNDRGAGGTAGGAAVERRLQLLDEGPVGRFIRPAGAERRHHAGPQLANDLLPYFGVRDDIGRVERVERQPRRPQPLIVAADAIAVEDLAHDRGIGHGRRRPILRHCCLSDHQSDR